MMCESTCNIGKSEERVRAGEISVPRLIPCDYLKFFGIRGFPSAAIKVCRKFAQVLISLY